MIFFTLSMPSLFESVTVFNEAIDARITNSPLNLTAGTKNRKQVGVCKS